MTEEQALPIAPIETPLAPTVQAPASQDNAAPVVVSLDQQTPVDIALSDAARKDLIALTLRAAEREQVKHEDMPAHIDRMKARLRALIEAIGPTSPATHTFAHRFDGLYTTHVKAGNEHALAMQDVQCIFLNRANDLKASLKQLDDPAFRAQLTEALATKAPELDTTLSATKLQEIKEELTRMPNGQVRAIPHFKNSFVADHKLHGALSDAFAADSDVAEALRKSMGESLPGDTGAHALVADWLALRAGRAQGVMEATRPDGELCQSAVAEWQAQYQAKAQGATVATANDTQPATVEGGKVQEIPSTAVAQVVQAAQGIKAEIESGLATPTVNGRG